MASSETQMHNCNAALLHGLFEITAINPNATAQKLSVNKRWFDLDDDGLQASIAQQPILIATHAAHRARAAERGPDSFDL